MVPYRLPSQYSLKIQKSFRNLGTRPPPLVKRNYIYIYIFENLDLLILTVVHSRHQSNYIYISLQCQKWSHPEVLNHILYFKSKSLTTSPSIHFLSFSADENSHIFVCSLLRRWVAGPTTAISAAPKSRGVDENRTFYPL